MLQLTNKEESMKKIILILIVTLICFTLAFGNTTGITENENNPTKKSFLIGKIGYFNPTEQSFKEIYGEGMAYGGKLDVNLSGKFGLWLEGSYFSKKGALTYTGEETTITLTPLNFGLNIHFGDKTFLPYIGGGGSYVILKEENDAMGTYKKNELGFVGQAGLLIKLGNSFVFDFCIEYNSCNIPKEDQAGNVDVGGFTGWFGIGFAI